MKIGYFADGPWSHLALERMLGDADLSFAFICARWELPDPILARMAAERQIDFLVTERVNADEFIQKISKYNCDIFVSMSFNQIFHAEILSVPQHGIINCHAGKLPRYRGRNILNWALINDESEFGITVHYVDQGVDTGDIISQAVFPISDADDYKTLLQRSYIGCADLLYHSVVEIRSGIARRIPQSKTGESAFYCVQRRAGDERLNWKQASREIFNFVRAICSPGPGARTSLGGHELRIDKVELVTNAPNYRGIPGSVVGKDGRAFHVKTSDTHVRVLEWECAVAPKIGDRLI